MIETPTLKDSGRGKGLERRDNELTNNQLSARSQEALMQRLFQPEPKVHLPFISHKVAPVEQGKNESHHDRRVN